jgi:hypothetical protein
MKKIIILLVLALIISCQQPIKEIVTDVKIEYSIENNFKIDNVFHFYGFNPMMALCRADNGDYVVSISNEKELWILTSSDKKNWTGRKQITWTENRVRPFTMKNIYGTLFFTTYIDGFNTEPEARSSILRSTDNGKTWHEVKLLNDYVITFSDVVVAGKVAVSLWHVIEPFNYDPQWKCYLDFGWYHLASNEIEVVSRVSTWGDNNSFPCENFILQKDDQIIMGVRYGEAPQKPFIQLKKSF